MKTLSPAGSQKPRLPVVCAVAEIQSEEAEDPKRAASVRAGGSRHSQWDPAGHVKSSSVHGQVFFCRLAVPHCFSWRGPAGCWCRQGGSPCSSSLSRPALASRSSTPAAWTSSVKPTQKINIIIQRALADYFTLKAFIVRRWVTEWKEHYARRKRDRNGRGGGVRVKGETERGGGQAWRSCPAKRSREQNPRSADIPGQWKETWGVTSTETIKAY